MEIRRQIAKLLERLTVRLGPSHIATLITMSGKGQNQNERTFKLSDPVSHLGDPTHAPERLPRPEPHEMQFLSSEIPDVSAETLKSAAEFARAGLIVGEDQTQLPPHRYSELLFLRYLENWESYVEDHVAALRMIGRAIGFHNTTSELQKLLYALYRDHFRSFNSEPLVQFQSIGLDHSILVLHLSCLPCVERARESAQSFQGPGVTNLTIVGDDTSERYKFDKDQEILYVPAPDSYEGLAVKTAAAYKFLSFAGLRSSVLKVDDDVSCVSLSGLSDVAIPLVQKHDYLGRVWRASEAGFSRWWHVGKCRDRALNEEPYSLIADALYAEGPAYALSNRALHILGKSAVYLKGQFASENSYEDLAVGKVLNFYGIEPFQFDLIRHGILTSSDAETRLRVGSETT